MHLAKKGEMFIPLCSSGIQETLQVSPTSEESVSTHPNIITV